MTSVVKDIVELFTSTAESTDITEVVLSEALLFLLYSPKSSFSVFTLEIRRLKGCYVTVLSTSKVS